MLITQWVLSLKTQDGFISKINVCHFTNLTPDYLDTNNFFYIVILFFQSVTAHSCRVTTTVRLAPASLPLTINCFLTPSGPVFIESVLLLELMNLFYQLQNCSATFGTTGRNCWNNA
jgi:hypothetical protein